MCPYPASACPPADSDPAGTTPPKPEAAQYGLPVAAATSGRLWAKVALVSSLPPPSMVPCQIWTSSAPAQPSAVLSTNQPATVNPPFGTVAAALGRSMYPSYVLSRIPPGPDVQVENVSAKTVAGPMTAPSSPATPSQANTARRKRRMRKQAPRAKVG